MPQFAGWLRALACGLLLSGSAFAVRAQSPRPQHHTVWQGFQVDWGYNHRLNRLGAWISADADEPPLARVSAASGSGADKAVVSCWLAEVQAPQWEAYAEATELELLGKEGEWVTASAVIRRFHNALPGEQAIVFLNGFDLVTAPGSTADKPLSLSFGIDSSWTDSSRQEFCYRVSARAYFKCSSPECPALNQEVSYLLRLHTVAWQGTSLSSTPTSVYLHTDWKKKQAGADASEELAGTNSGDGIQVLHLIRSIDFDLDREMHYRGLGFHLHEKAPGSTGQQALTFHFLQWATDQYANFREQFQGFWPFPASWATHASPGEANLHLKMERILLPKAQVVRRELSGEIHWQTRHKDQMNADSDAACQSWELK